MGKVLSKRKRKIQYRDCCLAIDVIQQATTVRTFGKETWVNLWNGFFGRQTSDGKNITKTLSLHELFQDIQTVAKKDVIIARKDYPDQVLRFLERPYVIGKRK